MFQLPDEDSLLAIETPLKTLRSANGLAEIGQSILMLVAGSWGRLRISNGATHSKHSVYTVVYSCITVSALKLEQLNFQ